MRKPVLSVMSGKSDTWDSEPEKIENEVLDSLKALVKVFVEGRNYETQNPYTRPEIKAALKAIGKATGQNCDYLDVKF